MRFKKGVKGYFKLGIIFTLFSGVFATLLTLVVVPMLFGGLIIGGAEGVLITIPMIFIVIVLLQGWFLHWFYRENRFK